MKNIFVSLLLVIFVNISLHAETWEFDFPLKEEEKAQLLPYDSEMNLYDQSKFWWWFTGSDDKDDNKGAKHKLNLKNVLDLENRINERVFGQRLAVKLTAESIIRYAAGVNDPDSPIATFLYIGPTGVGKTELAKQLAYELYADREYMIRFNMSEFADASSLTRLIGSGPGYIDSDKGGQLTGPLLQNSNRIILLDEIDKAHSKVLKLFLQAFDEGQMTSAMGKKVNCRNAIFILTTNYGAEDILNLKAQGYENKQILTELEPFLMNAMTPELYNRCNPIIFEGLSHETLNSIVLKLLNDLNNRIKKNNSITLKFDQSMIDHLQEVGYHPTLGARPLKRLIESDLTTVVAKCIIQGVATKGDTLTFYYSDEKIICDHQKLPAK